MEDRLLRIPEVAQLTGLSTATIRSWRQKGFGPRAAKLGGAVMYRESEVRAWIDEQFDQAG